MIDGYYWVDCEPNEICDICQKSLCEVAARFMPPEIIQEHGIYPDATTLSHPEYRPLWNEAWKKAYEFLGGRRCLKVGADMDVILVCKEHLKEMIGSELD
jgi:quinolinate synthase